MEINTGPTPPQGHGRCMVTSGNPPTKNTPLGPLVAFFTGGVEPRAYFGTTGEHLGYKSPLVIMQGGNKEEEDRANRVFWFRPCLDVVIDSLHL